MVPYVIFVVLAVAFGIGLKIAYARGLATTPESAKPRFGRKEALELKPILEKLGGATTAVMAEYTTRLVSLLGAVNNLSGEVAAVVAQTERRIGGSKAMISATLAEIENAKKAIGAREVAIAADEAGKAAEIALGKLFGV